MIERPEVMREGVLDMQVCVPITWSDEQVVEFANRSNPCGTSNGWFIRKQGSELLAGANERVACGAPSRERYAHITLDA